MDIYSPPSNHKRTIYSNIRDKKRRVNFTIYTLQNINQWFGNLSTFIAALHELKKACNENKYNLNALPPEIDKILFTEDDYFKKMQEESRVFAPILITLGRYTRKQYSMLKKQYKFFLATQPYKETGNLKKILLEKMMKNFFYH